MWRLSLDDHGVDPARQAVGAGDCDRDGSGAGHYYAGIGLCGTGRCRCDWTDGWSRLLLRDDRFKESAQN